MPRKKRSKDSPATIPETTVAPFESVQMSAPTKGSHLRVVKEFDLRAAHHAWKERNGIESDGSW